MKDYYLPNSVRLSLVFILLFCSSCGSEPPTVEVQAAESSPAILRLVDVDLLATIGADMRCDHGEGATISCENQPAHVVMDATVPASSYARWSIQLPKIEQPLQGDEILTIEGEATGDTKQTLYFVQEDGLRLSVSLESYGLHPGSNHLFIPLNEIHEADGDLFDFSKLQSIQIVYEYVDMASHLVLNHVKFVSAWSEAVAVNQASPKLAAALQMPAGFQAEVMADALSMLTQIQFTSSGEMLVSLQSGRVWRYIDADQDGRYDRRFLYASGFEEIVGLLYDPIDQSVWIGGRGQLYHTLDTDGNHYADQLDLKIDGLKWGRHQNNGMVWNPAPDPFSGEPANHWIYFGLGSEDDLASYDPNNATILRFPRTGQSRDALEIVSTGNRNAYAVTWGSVLVDPTNPTRATQWQLFASENGPDFNQAPDEVNHIRWQHHYGFPQQFGMVENVQEEGAPYSSPVVSLPPHASADGLIYVDNQAWPAEYRGLYVALFGQLFDAVIVGHTVEQILLTPYDIGDDPGSDTDKEQTYRGETKTFISGLDRPLPLALDPQGNLVVGDYATGVIYRIFYRKA